LKLTFEIVTLVLLKIEVFWDVNLCCWAGSSWCLTAYL